MTDIVDRLRAGEPRRLFLADLPDDGMALVVPLIPTAGICREAAAEIELLRAAVAQQQAELDALRAAPQQAEPEEGPWATRERFYEAIDRAVENMRQEMQVKTVTMRLREYDIALPIMDAHGGHVLVGPSAAEPGKGDV